jgi:hypothetical protein
VIFLTDGLASDYKPDNQGKDLPFGGDYSKPLQYAGAPGEEFCRSRGWCDSGESGCITTPKVDASTCSPANVIRSVKDMPGTNVVGVYVGDRAGYGPQVLHNVSSCDTYTFDPAHPHACPNTFSADSFVSLKATIIPTVNKLMEKAQSLQGICEACSPGMFAANDGAECIDCPVGMFGTNTGLTGCTACPEDHFSTAKGLTSVSECRPLCGLMNNEEITRLCADRGANGLVLEAMTTALCSGATCDSSGPSSPDAAICCLPDVTCSSVNSTGKC